MALFTLVVVGCGLYSGIFQSIWTNFFPSTCAPGNTALFTVEINAFPARLGDQSNACAGIGDGECTRVAGEEIIRGECRKGQMHGPWSVKNTKTSALSWSGTYCNGLPCGDFRARMDDVHEQTFRVENLQLQGPATIWEKEGSRWFEVSGRYDRGKRTGRWVRHTEPGHTLSSASIYDDNGFVSTTSFYCTNGNRREVRGKNVFLFDAQGNTLAKSSPDVDDATHCPLP